MNETCSNVNAECVNSVGSYSCQCKQGYTGDGDNCTGQSFTRPHTLKVNLPNCYQVILLLDCFNIGMIY